MSSFSVRFLTRPRCHLCDDARPLVEWAVGKAGVDLEEIDVDGDDPLLSLYGMRIPVVLGPDDEVIAEGVIVDRKALRKAISSLWPA
ncbi:MAG: glutaredoxin family protein [Acidimicrobiia bacterium]